MMDGPKSVGFDAEPGFLEQAARNRCQLIQSMARKEDVKTKHLDRLADQMFSAGVANSKKGIPPVQTFQSASPVINAVGAPLSHSPLTSAQYRVSSKAVLEEHPSLGVLRTVEPPINFSSRSKFSGTHHLLYLKINTEDGNNVAPQNSPVSTEPNRALNHQNFGQHINSSSSEPQKPEDLSTYPTTDRSDWSERNPPSPEVSDFSLDSDEENMNFCLRNMGNLNVEIRHQNTARDSRSSELRSRDLELRNSENVKPKRYVEMFIPRVEQDTDMEASREKMKPHVVASDNAIDDDVSKTIARDASFNPEGDEGEYDVTNDGEDGGELEYQKGYDWEERTPRPDPHLMKLEALLSPLKMSPNISELAVAFEAPSPESSHVSFSPKKSSNQFSSTFKLMKEIYKPQLMNSPNGSPSLTPRGTKEINKTTKNSQTKVATTRPNSTQPIPTELNSPSRISIASLTFFEDLKPFEKVRNPENPTDQENLSSPVSTRVIKGKKKIHKDENPALRGNRKEKSTKNLEGDSSKLGDRNDRNSLTTITFGSKEVPNEVEFSTTTKQYSEPKNTSLDLSKYLKTSRGAAEFRTQYISITAPKPQMDSRLSDGITSQRSVSSSNALSPFKNKRIKSAPANTRLKFQPKSGSSRAEKIDELGSLILLPSNEKNTNKKHLLVFERDPLNPNRVATSARPLRKL